MKNKAIITTLVCLIIALSSFVMFACGGDGKTSYQYYTTFFNTIKTEGAMFESGNALGVQTNYQLKNFQSKTFDGETVTPVDDDQNYLILLANGLNFIEKYYPRLEENKNTSLKSGINDMTDSFDQLLIEYQNIIDVSDKANYEIYNGNFARYKWQTKDFINNVYQSALDLGNLIYKDLDIDGTKETLSQEETQTEGDENTPTKEEIADTFDLEFYFDYQNILILEDYRAFLMDSAIGQQLDYSLYQTVDVSLTLFTGVIGQNLKDLSAQGLISYIDLCQRFASERAYTAEAIGEFSCYEFVNDYDQNIDSYETSVSGASIYKLQIEKYFGDYISKFVSFVSSNVVA